MAGHSTNFDSRIEILLADITRQDTDAIVNAANSHLAHGGGVALAIARAAGPLFIRESEEHPFVPVGGCGLTSAGELRCSHVIHAVGPAWRGGKADEPRLLASAYRSALELAEQIGCRSVAFPSISTGIFGYPVTEAALIATRTVGQALRSMPQIELVRFCLFSESDLAAYEEAIAADRR